MSLTKNPGRFAGSLYLLGSIPGWFAIEYVPSKLFAHVRNLFPENDVYLREGKATDHAISWVVQRQVDV